jgi:hypothetical protein
VANMFSRSDPRQKAGMLSQLFGAAGPWLGSGLRTNSARPMRRNSTGTEQPSQSCPVSELPTEAHKQDPSSADTVSAFYAQHPTPVKGLGAAALATARSHMSKRAA